jgi:release factor glutamine methyltransferase
MRVAVDERRTGGIRALLDAAIERLAQRQVENPRLDAELLLAEATGISRERLYAGELAIDGFATTRYSALLERRAGREPIAYILGRKEFYSIELQVSPAVLIPRPETEIVVEAALEFLTANPNSRVLDMGTGSGAIAFAIGVNAPHALVVATDISAAALDVAKRNSRRLADTESGDVERASTLSECSRVDFRHADCFEVLDDGPGLGRFDLIISNPPYIRDAEIELLQPEVSRYEPRIALAGGSDGINFYRRIVRGLHDHLAPTGAVIVEVGDGQSNAVAELFREAGLSRIDVPRDLSGAPRVVRAN